MPTGLKSVKGFGRQLSKSARGGTRSAARSTKRLPRTLKGTRGLRVSKAR